MALSALDDTSREPSEADLRKALGVSRKRRAQLIQAVADRVGPVDEQWHAAGATYGWSMRLRQQDRTLLYLIPQAGSFLAGIVLGEKAVTAAHAQKLPAAILAAVDAAPRYAEGRGLRLPVKSAADVRAFATLVQLKMATGRMTRRLAGR